MKQHRVQMMSVMYRWAIKDPLAMTCNSVEVLMDIQHQTITQPPPKAFAILYSFYVVVDRCGHDSEENIRQIFYGPVDVSMPKLSRALRCALVSVWPLVRV